MPLEPDEIRAVLARAQEIQSASSPGEDDVQAVIHAAEEVGISRSAIERALRERLVLPMKPPAAGDLVFARSADDRFYAAEVDALTGDEVRVRFLRGGQHTLALDELRPCRFLPGEQVYCPWPGWGAWKCTVLGYDASTREVTVSDGWAETRAFPIDQIWIAPPRPAASRRRRLYAALLGIGAAAGAAVGALLTALFMG